jgi:hypothetical protein
MYTNFNKILRFILCKNIIYKIFIIFIIGFVVRLFFSLGVLKNILYISSFFLVIDYNIKNYEFIIKLSVNLKILNKNKY